MAMVVTNDEYSTYRALHGLVGYSVIVSTTDQGSVPSIQGIIHKVGRRGADKGLTVGVAAGSVTIPFAKVARVVIVGGR